MKIAYVLEKFPSPTEYFILNEMLQFEKSGFELLLLVLQRQKQYENIPELKSLKANILYLPRFYFYFPLFLNLGSAFSILRVTVSRFPAFVFHLFKNIRYYGIAHYFAKKKIHVDHIHAHFAFISVDVAYYLSKILKVDYSFATHAQDIYTNHNKVQQHLPETKFLITCTEYNKNYLNKLSGNLYRDKIHKVYHGIDLEKWPKNNLKTNFNNELQILTIARLVKKKGLIYLIRAIEKLNNNGIKAHCTIIGQGHLLSFLKEYIYSNKLQNFIQIKPFVLQNELKKYYSKADVFVLPSIIGLNGDRDGLPNVIIEAMLIGIPVVSTPISAIPEVIKHKETGILVKEADEQALMEGITMLANNKSLQQHIINNARREIEEKFDIKTSTKKLMEIFTINTPSFQS